MKLSFSQEAIIAAVAVLAIGLLLLKKNLATDAGAAVAHAAADTVGGVAMGIGDELGIPRTNETECERAKREGRILDASFACPAGDFLSFINPFK